MEVIETRFEAIQWGAFEAEHFADLSRGNDYVLYKVLPVPFSARPSSRTVSIKAINAVMVADRI